VHPRRLWSPYTTTEASVLDCQGAPIMSWSGSDLVGMDVKKADGAIVASVTQAPTPFYSAWFVRVVVFVAHHTVLLP
jgi:hypothetical protein